MPQNTKKGQPAVTQKSVIMRQMIAITVALSIMGLGAWSLMGQRSPYHPDAYSDEVSRDGIFNWFGGKDIN